MAVFSSRAPKTADKRGSNCAVACHKKAPMTSCTAMPSASVKMLWPLAAPPATSISARIEARLFKPSPTTCPPSTACVGVEAQLTPVPELADAPDTHKAGGELYRRTELIEDSNVCCVSTKSNGHIAPMKKGLSRIK